MENYVNLWCLTASADDFLKCSKRKSHSGACDFIICSHKIQVSALYNNMYIDVYQYCNVSKSVFILYFGLNGTVSCTCMSMWVTFLPIVSHYSTDPRVAVREEDGKLVNMDLHNAQFMHFIYFKNLLCKCFYMEGNSFNTFVRPPGCRHFV